MLRLMRGQEVFGRLSMWLVHSGLTASVLLGLLAWSRGPGLERSRIELSVLVLVVAWFSLGTFLLFGKVRTRCSDLQLVLPYSSRRLWLAHVWAVAAAGAGLVVVVLAVVEVHQWGLGSLVDQGVDGPSLLRLGSLLLAGLLLAVVLIESRRLDLQSPPVDALDVLWRVGVIVALTLASLALIRRPLLGALALLGGAALVSAWTLARLPGTFLLSGADERRTRTSSLPVSAWTAGGSLGRIRTVGRLVAIVHGARFGVWATVMMLPFVALCGAMASGMFGIWSDLEDLRFLYIPLYVYMLFNSLPAGMEQLAHLDPLPVSRRSMFALLVLPLLVSFAVGYGVGALALELKGRDRPRIVYEPLRGESHYRLSVPMAHNRLTLAASPPEITSPWGETHQPRGVRLASFAPLYGYSPFSTPERSSPEFVALQMSRAIEAVYGAHLEPEELSRRYLVSADEGTVLRQGGLSLEEDFGLRPLWAGPLFPALLAMTSVPFLLLAALFQRTYRAGSGGSARRRFWMVTLAVAMALLVLQLALSIGGVIEMWAARALIEVPLQQYGTSALGAALVWVLAAVLIGLAYRLAERAFFKAELPVRPTVLKLI